MNNFFKKCFASLGVALVLVSTPYELCAVTNYSNNHHDALQIHVNQDCKREVEITEKFLQRQVPGLSVSYRDVFNAIISEGHQLYIKGGFFRDLLSEDYVEPNDIDFGYSCSKEQLIEIIDKHQWKYTVIPNSKRVIIGEGNGQFLEGVQQEIFKPTDINQVEYTVNTIFYDVNARRFLEEHKVGIEDLEIKRLNVLSDDLKTWLYISSKSHPFQRIFRFWRMVGKGYSYSINLEKFIKNEIANHLEESPEHFQEEVIDFASTHFHSFDELVRGCSAIMGYEWCQKHLIPFKDEAEARSLEEERRIENLSTY
ncbi:MAG: hypothetical protein VX777_05025 [Chlamydiota bacterium]|nr:hypothetical protein [Chlamydiota bacterium]